MTKSRILEFSTYAKIGGTQKMLLEFLRYASHDTYVYSMCVLLEHDLLNDEVSKLAIENTALTMRGYWDISAWWRLYWFIKNKQFSLMRTYGLKADIIGRIVGRLAGIPVHITSVRSTDPWRKWYHVWLDRVTSGLTDLYLSNSEAGRLAVIEREHIPESKTFTIPNGVDIKLFEPTQYERAGIPDAYRKAFGIPLEAPILGIVANLCKMKGHDVVLDALPLIREIFPDVRCVCVGSDFLNGAVHRLAQKKGLGKCMIFTGFRADIPELLSMFDLFLLPSLWEGLPTAVLEAMAMKIPVIATAVGGIPELLDDGQSGRLIPSKDAKALAEAVISLLTNPEMAAGMRDAAYTRVEQQFSMTAMVKNTEAVYEQLINRKLCKLPC